MASSSHQTLERIARRVPVPEPAHDRLLRRRDRKERNRRLSAGALAIFIALVGFMALTRAFRTAGRPADEPTPAPKPPGIFSELGGWIVYAAQGGIRAVDPSHLGDGDVQLSSDEGIPLAWSTDGSELLISRGTKIRLSRRQLLNLDKAAPSRRGLFVLHADGTETRLVSDVVSGASFSPDGTTVVFAPEIYWPARLDPGIYLIDADGGVPRLLLARSRRYFPEVNRTFRTELSFPTFSPDGTQIAFIDGMGDWGNSLRVMNADGSDVHALGLVAGAPDLGGHTMGLSWSPDGRHLAVGLRDLPHREPSGIYVGNADGSRLTLTIPNAAVDPYWSPGGSRISFDAEGPGGFLAIAARDGTHIQWLGYGKSGPWNPLVQPEPGVAKASAASEGLALATALPLAVALLALVAGVALIRRRRWRNATRLVRRT